ncbi:hypothetical protein GPA22_17670 [Aromatoleum toluvorans]|uniref:Uncharacterized protein n=1 Tax=Aromatoleum toluvorans TaxID=92002 RepID=A0ABX1Q5A2_9RHOO|nr:hypothetical protein [Aromatoleum toluvorans]NMG45546.1 hypothetical protein [Aromatoleum toluvorans]
MVDFLRMIRAWGWFGVGVLLAALPMLAFADTYNATHQYYVSVILSPSQVFSTPSATCTAVNAADARYGPGVAESYPGSGTWQCWNANYTYPSVLEKWVCPYGGTLSSQAPWICQNAPLCPDGEARDASGQCVSMCPAGKVWDSTAQTCKDPCSQFAGNSYGSPSSWATLDVATMGGTGNTTFCDGQCAVSGGKVECQSASSIGASGDTVALGYTCVVQGPFVHTGKSCGDAGASAKLISVEANQNPWWKTGDDAKKCAESGGYWGQVNGQDACVRSTPGDGTTKTTNTETAPKTTTTTNPDGSTTTTTESSKTTCSGAICSTETTKTTGGTNADGSSKSPTTETNKQEQPKGDFCQQNPTVAGCEGTKKDGTFGGSCAGGFTCTGDAVQCATAEALHKQECTRLAEKSEQEGAAQSYLNGFAAEIPQAKVDQALNAAGDYDVDVWQQFQEAQQTYVNFTAECLPDLFFDLKGQRYTFDVGWICGIGDFVRMMMHIIAYMGVLSIVGRGFSK